MHTPETEADLGKHLNAEKRAMKSDPLSMAVRRRDENTLAMVEEAIRFHNVKLAYQPIVQAQRPDKVALDSGEAFCVLRPGGGTHYAPVDALVEQRQEMRWIAMLQPGEGFFDEGTVGSGFGHGRHSVR